MEFDLAIRKLQRDHTKLRQQKQKKTAATSSAKKQQEQRRRQYEKIKQQKKERQDRLHHVEKYMNRWDASLKIHEDFRWKLRPSSIYGNGDKITLSVDILQALMENATQENRNNPYTFRIAIRNPKYQFPSSSKLHTMMNDLKFDDNGELVENDDSDEETEEMTAHAYLEELSERYLSYTHATVVEFTQEEGFVGLPRSIASKLLDGVKSSSALGKEDEIGVFRTADPAVTTNAENDYMDDDVVEEKPQRIKTNPDKDDEDEEEKTAGHVAWGLFDLPDTDIEVTMVVLPKGTRCTLVPTQDAILNGFYTLKDVKAVLEQSLIRTRATLSLQDRVHTWHRGMKFDLIVDSVTPSDYGSISCINTDIEVDIAPPPSTDKDKDEIMTDASSSPTKDVGRTLVEPNPSKVQQQQPRGLSPMFKKISSYTPEPEPPSSQTENICTIQIRSPTAAIKKRFDITKSKMMELFQLALETMEEPFQLVTRFPRRVFVLEECWDVLLVDAGIQPGQEMFMVEKRS